MGNTKKYPFGWCGMCNEPAIGIGKMPLSVGIVGSSVRVCAKHKARVVDFKPYKKNEG